MVAPFYCANAAVYANMGRESPYETFPLDISIHSRVTLFLLAIYFPPYGIRAHLLLLKMLKGDNFKLRLLAKY